MDKERLDEQRLEEDVFNINFKIGKKKAIAWMLSIALVVASVPLTVGAASARRSHINSTGVFEYKEAGSTKVRIDSADLLYMADEVDGVDESLSDIENDVTTLEDAVSDITAYGKGNASGSDLLSGKTAWVNGSMITGSMTNNGALSKSFTPSTSSQSYTIPAGYTSGGTVTCAAIPNQRSASNKSLTCKNDSVTYSSGWYPNSWTVTSTYDGYSSPSLTTRSITPSTSSQTIYASSYGYDGFSSVTVNAIQTETKTITPTSSSQTVYPSSGKYFSSVTVGAATGGTPTQKYTITTSGSSASDFSNIDMTNGGSTLYRYVDASSVYTKGYNQYPIDHPIDIPLNNASLGSTTFTKTNTTCTVRDMSDYQWIMIGTADSNVTSNYILAHSGLRGIKMIIKYSELKKGSSYTLYGMKSTSGSEYSTINGTFKYISDTQVSFTPSQTANWNLAIYGIN